MAFNEKPPILTGSEQQQINALRDYLFRMVSSLDTIETAPVVAFSDSGEKVKLDSQTLEAIRENTASLKALIISNADTITSYVDQKTETYEEQYQALSSRFGTYEENITRTIEETARGVVDSYKYKETIDAIRDGLNGLSDQTDNYFTQINGQIRRGFIEDPPNSGTYTLGIAISQNLQFDAEIAPQDDSEGYRYYHLKGGQTLGLYTSAGWQFWIDGVKVGWFSSKDSMLHVRQIQVEESLQFGDKWKLKTAADGTELEIVYIGNVGDE